MPVQPKIKSLLQRFTTLLVLLILVPLIVIRIALWLVKFLFNYKAAKTELEYLGTD